MSSVDWAIILYLVMYGLLFYGLGHKAGYNKAVEDMRSKDGDE